jgi:hypothetical protein
MIIINPIDDFVNKKNKDFEKNFKILCRQDVVGLGATYRHSRWLDLRTVTRGTANIICPMFAYVTLAGRRKRRNPFAYTA